MWRIFFPFEYENCGQNSIQTKFQMWNYNPYLCMETVEPLSQSGSWQFSLVLLGHMQQDANEEKEQARNMRGNAKTICTELGFLRCWYNRVLLVIFTRVQSPSHDYNKKKKQQTSHRIDFRELVWFSGGKIRVGVRKQGSSLAASLMQPWAFMEILLKPFAVGPLSSLRLRGIICKLWMFTVIATSEITVRKTRCSVHSITSGFLHQKERPRASLYRYSDSGVLGKREHNCPGAHVYDMSSIPLSLGHV